MSIKFSSLLAVTLFVAAAQETAPEGFQLWSAVSLGQIEQQLITQAAGNPNHLATKRLVDYPNDLYMLTRRQADGVVEWHENQVDVFFVQSGTATLIVGGNMVGGETTEPNEKRGGRIEGGMRRTLSAGDVVRIPAKTAHQILLEGSKGFTYFVIKVKGY
jgi:mannose-6-phosphate isomerase-like protein (cupin superfamily)